jgi:hypothetical protein
MPLLTVTELMPFLKLILTGLTDDVQVCQHLYI